MLMSPVSHLMRVLINQYTHVAHTHTQADATFCQVFEKFCCKLNFFWRVLVGSIDEGRKGGGKNLRMMLWRMMSRCRRQKPTHVKVKNNTWGGRNAVQLLQREMRGGEGSNTKGAIVAAVVVFGQLETFVEALKCTQNGILTHTHTLGSCHGRVL